MGLFVGMGPYVDKHFVPKKKKIYCYISVHKTREPHTKFLCLIDDVFCFQTTIPEILFMETCAE